MTEPTAEDKAIYAQLMLEAAVIHKAQEGWPDAAQLWKERELDDEFVINEPLTAGLTDAIIQADAYYKGRGLKPGRAFVGRRRYAQRGNLRDFFDPCSGVLEAKGRIGVVFGVEVCIGDFIPEDEVHFQPAKA